MSLDQCLPVKEVELKCKPTLVGAASDGQGDLGVAGDRGSEVEDEVSMSARRQLWQQYAPPDVCLSQAKQ